eukprot:1302572-Alexandrium_andersonii.AAC.1
MTVADLWSAVQLSRLGTAGSWPAVAEFSICPTGKGKFAASRAPVEGWSDELCAVIAMNEHAEPIFFA